MKNILIATDLTMNSDRALERAVKLAKFHNAKLHIIHVTPVYQLSDKNEGAEASRQDKEDLIHAYLSGYKESKAVKTVIHVIESENAFAEIINCSQTCKADLIVMGVHNKFGFRDLFVGTTIERVIRKGSKPVLMVIDKPKSDYKKVVIGCDFSDSAKSAFHFALSISSDPSINLVHSYDYADTATGQKIEIYADDIIKNKEAEQLQNFIKDSDKILKKYKVPPENFSHNTVKGPAQSVLAAEVKNFKADLLAIGVNSRSGFISSKLGGVTQDILASPPCDVLVAKEQ